MSSGAGRARSRRSRSRSPLRPSSPVLPAAAPPAAAPPAAAPPSATQPTAPAAQEPAPVAEEPVGSSPPAPASPSFSMPGALASPQPISTALAAPQLPSPMLSSSHTIHHPDQHDQSWDARTVHRRYSMTSDVGSVIVHDDPDGLSVPWRDPTDNASISASASASASQALAPGVRIPPGAASALRATAAGRRDSPRDNSSGFGRAASDRSGSATPVSERLAGGFTETETETETEGEGQGRREGRGQGAQGAGQPAAAAADTLEREATLAKGMGELEAVLGEELGALERRRATAGGNAPAGQDVGSAADGAGQGQAAQPPLGLPPRPPSRRPSEPGAAQPPPPQQQQQQQPQQWHPAQLPALPAVSTGASSSSCPPVPAPAALLPLPPLPPPPQTPSLAPRAAPGPTAHAPSTNSPSLPQDTTAAPASPFSATAAPYIPSPFAGAAPVTPTAVTPTAAAAAPGTCAVTLAAEQLDPGVAAALLEELAEHVLTADIGFSSAANPVRLHRSLAALQATPGELAYMMCHTALLGDPRVLELVPLAVVEPTRGRSGHRGHTHTLSGGSSQAGAGTAAAAADAAAAGAAGAALPRGAGSVGLGVGERPGTDTGHARRPLRGRWSLSGVAGRPASGPVGNVAREAPAGSADEPGSAGLGAEGGAGGAAAGPGSTAAERGLQYWFFGRRVSRDGAAGGVQPASGGPSSPLMWLASPTLGSAGRGIGVDIPASGSSPVPSPMPHQRSQHKQHQHSRNPSVASVAQTVCTNLDSEAAQDDVLLPQAPSVAHSTAAEGDKQAPAAGTAARAANNMPTTLEEAAAMSTESNAAPSGVSSPAVALAPAASEHGRAAAPTLHTVPEQGASPSVSRSDASSSSNVSGTAAGSELPAQPPPPPAPQAPPQQPSSTGHFWPFSRHRRARSNPMSSLVLHSPGAEGDQVTDNDEDLMSASPRSVPGGGNQTPTGGTGGGGGGRGASGGGAAAAGAAGGTETGVRRYRWGRRVSEQGDAAAGKEAAASTGGATDAAQNGTAHSRTPTGNAAHGHTHTHGGSEAGVFVSGAAAGRGWNVPTVTPQRLSELHAFTAAVQSVATALSKKERMKAIMGRLLTKHGTCASSVCGDGGAGAVAGVARSEVGSEAVA